MLLMSGSMDIPLSNIGCTILFDLNALLSDMSVTNGSIVSEMVMLLLALSSNEFAERSLFIVDMVVGVLCNRLVTEAKRTDHDKYGHHVIVSRRARIAVFVGRQEERARRHAADTHDRQGKSRYQYANELKFTNMCLFYISNNC